MEPKSRMQLSNSRWPNLDVYGDMELELSRDDARYCQVCQWDAEVQSVGHVSGLYDRIQILGVAIGQNLIETSSEVYHGIFLVQLLSQLLHCR